MTHHYWREKRGERERKRRASVKTLMEIRDTISLYIELGASVSSGPRVRSYLLQTSLLVCCSFLVQAVNIHPGVKAPGHMSETQTDVLNPVLSLTGCYLLHRVLLQPHTFTFSAASFTIIKGVLLLLPLSGGIKASPIRSFTRKPCLFFIA